jgi:aminoglycoside phosphotransferase
VDGPVFDSYEDYRARLGDLDTWRPYLDRVVGDVEAVPGFNPTFPTFVCGDVVVKFFGFVPRARETYVAEQAACALVATAQLRASRLLGSGEAGWPYLLLARMPGVASHRADLTSEEHLALAAEVGREIGRLHTLPIPDGLPLVDPADLDIAEGVGRSSLPEHLRHQAPGYVQRLGPMDPVVVHSDLCAMHVFVEHGRMSGIIDWGETAVADRHHELIQVYRDLCACDPERFRAFLDAADWPVADDFAQRTLGHALVRQSRGRRIDVFLPVAARYPLDEVATLDDLAELLFAQS